MNLINKNILIVDDDIKGNLKELLADPLILLGYNVKTEYESKEGIKEASHKYSAILIDFQFDDQDIHAPIIFEEIIKKAPFCTLILVTGKGSDKVAEIATMEIDGYIGKDKLGGPIKSRDLGFFLEAEITKAFNNKLNNDKYCIFKEFDEGKHKDSLQSVIDVLDEIERIFSSENRTEKSPKDAKYLARKASHEFIYKRKSKQKGDLSKISSTAFKNPFLFNKNPFSNALKTLYVLINNPEEKWGTAKKDYKQLRDFMQYFGL